MQTTSVVSSRSTMLFQLTRKAPSTVALYWIGTTRTDKCTYPYQDTLTRHSKYSSTKTPRNSGPASPEWDTNMWCKCAVYSGRKSIKIIGYGREEICPSSVWNIPVLLLWNGGIWKHVGGPKQHIIPTNKPNCRHIEEDTIISRLCSQPFRWNLYIQTKQHGLAEHSDASYLSDREARSRGHLYLSTNLPNNGAVLIIV